MDDDTHWPLSDLGSNGDLARMCQVGRSTICNWIYRYPDFPAPLRELSSGNVYSMKQVREWYDRRDWQKGSKHQHVEAGYNGGPEMPGGSR